jgi:hypothetical protein
MADTTNQPTDIDEGKLDDLLKKKLKGEIE